MEVVGSERREIVGGLPRFSLDKRKQRQEDGVLKTLS